ncbi:MAG: hypothetical protein KJT03_22155 [Verrucomicrobiae bacterium]|nr:hypothetical protein [Verrucomicrobiae bacterium]
MNNKIRALLLLVGWILIPFGATKAEDQTSPPEHQLEPYKTYEVEILPMPAYHPVSAISATVMGANIEIKLTIDAKGNPSRVRLARHLSSYLDLDLRTFAAQMEYAVKRWKFEPATDARGDAIPVKAILPIKAVDKAGRTPTQFAILLDKESMTD